MKLIVDTNVVISAVMTRSFVQRIIFNEKLELYSPDFLLEELEGQEKEIKRRTKYSDAELKELLNTILEKITIIPEPEYGYLEFKAKGTSPDEKDWPFIALSLELNLPIWTRDKPLLETKALNTISTSEIIRKLEL